MKYPKNGPSHHFSPDTQLIKDYLDNPQSQGQLIDLIHPENPQSDEQVFSQLMLMGTARVAFVLYYLAQHTLYARQQLFKNCIDFLLDSDKEGIIWQICTILTNEDNAPAAERITSHFGNPDDRSHQEISRRAASTNQPVQKVLGSIPSPGAIQPSEDTDDDLNRVQYITKHGFLKYFQHKEFQALISIALRYPDRRIEDPTARYCAELINSYVRDDQNFPQRFEDYLSEMAQLAEIAPAMIPHAEENLLILLQAYQLAANFPKEETEDLILNFIKFVQGQPGGRDLIKKLAQELYPNNFASKEDKEFWSHLQSKLALSGVTIISGQREITIFDKEPIIDVKPEDPQSKSLFDGLRQAFAKSLKKLLGSGPKALPAQENQDHLDNYGFTPEQRAFLQAEGVGNPRLIQFYIKSLGPVDGHQFCDLPLEVDCTDADKFLKLAADVSARRLKLAMRYLDQGDIQMLLSLYNPNTDLTLNQLFDKAIAHYETYGFFDDHTFQLEMKFNDLSGNRRNMAVTEERPMKFDDEK